MNALALGSCTAFLAVSGKKFQYDEIAFEGEGQGVTTVHDIHLNYLLSS